MLDNNSIFVLEVICWAVSGIAGFMTLLFEYFASGQISTEATQKKYLRTWETIRDTGLPQLPETIICFILRWKGSLPAVATKLKDWIIEKGWRFGVLYLFSLLVTLLGLNFLFGLSTTALILGIWVVVVLIGYVTVLMKRETVLNAARLAEVLKAARLDKVLNAGRLADLDLEPALKASFTPRQLRLQEVALYTIALPLITGAAFFLSFALSNNIFLAGSVMLGGGPLFVALVTIAVDAYGSLRAGVVPTDQRPIVLLFGFSIAVSFAVTFAGMLIGHFADNTAWVPQTFQVLLANVLCDGATVLTTFWILGASVGPNRRYPIPVALVLDLAVAALLACMALWFGLIGTEKALSLSQVLNVLIGLTPEGQQFAIGPYFWVMHTTFIPTLIFLFVVFLCWIGKLIVLPGLRKVIGRGQEIENPHHHTAMTFALVAFVFGVLAEGLRRFLLNAS